MQAVRFTGPALVKLWVCLENRWTPPNYTNKLLKLNIPPRDLLPSDKSWIKISPVYRFGIRQGFLGAFFRLGKHVVELDRVFNVFKNITSSEGRRTINYLSIGLTVRSR